MEIAEEDSFRIRSYRNGATAIEGNVEAIEALLVDPSRKLTEIPGIGKGLALVVQEIAERGSCDKRDRLLTKFPPAALEFLKIQGLGPKSIALLFEHFHVRSIDELEDLCVRQKLRDLPRMGAKLEEKVLRSIAQYRLRTGRHLLSFAEQTATELLRALRDLPGVSSASAAGSLRRGRETVGDLDLLVTGPDPGPALDLIANHPRTNQILGRGANKTSVTLGREGFQVDVRALPKESFGAAMQYFTGSKEHNVAIRMRAIKMGLKLSEYGLFRLEDDARVAGETEEEVYAALGLAWIPPEIRENQGEIELAEAHNLPRLIERTDLRGDVHMHTTATDGRGTLEEMAIAAKELGHEYIAITDHSKALAMANGLDERRVTQFAREVRQINERGDLGIHVFAGLECDILRTGELDITQDALAELDVVIGSVHSHMDLDSAEMTDRLMRAMQSPSLRILGHPTGRRLLSRDSYPYNTELVFAEAAKRGVALEINASPERLDLNGQLARAAKAKGVKFAISTDAHHPKHLSGIRYGIATARRGWIERQDVLNALPLEGFAAAMKL